MRQDAGYWIAWSKVTGIGATRLKRLWEHFGDLEAAWRAPHSALVRAGLDGRVAAAAVAERGALDPLAELTLLESAGVGLITIDDPAYPALLRRGDGAPAFLHVRGELLPEDEMSIAVVGSRAVTSYGRQVTQQFTTDLARQGLDHRERTGQGCGRRGASRRD